MKARSFLRRGAFLLALVLVFLSFASCASFGGLLTPTKERIEKLVERRPDGIAGSVTDSLLYWEVPRFYTPDLRDLEAVVNARFSPDGETVKALAHKTVRRFLDEEYDEIDPSNYSAVTVALYRCYLDACREFLPLDVAPTAEALSAAMANTDGEYEFAAYWFLAWGMPYFDLYKLITIETVLRREHFPALPDTKTLALRALDGREEEILSACGSDTTALTDTLIRAFVLAIDDRYAVYRTAEEGEAFNEDMSGSYVGIGISVQYSYADQTILITSVNKNGPAAEAGILEGDYIVAVDGKRTDEIGYDGTLATVRGIPDTEVRVTVLRGEEEIEIPVKRKQITVESVTYELRPDGIAYVTVTEFKGNTGTQFIGAIRRAEEDGARALLFDVRSNPGGYLSAVCTAIDDLVPAGTPIVSFNEEYHTAPILAETDHSVSLPIAVLCNGYTASAGELFTSSLRDYAKMGLLDATVIGTTTYKKGIMQSGFVLSDGSSVTFTVAQYNPPSGENYDGIGITPEGDNYVENTEGNDEQLDRAIAVLTAKIAK